MTSPQGFAMTPRWLVERNDVSDRAVRLFAILSGRVREGGIKITQTDLAALLGVTPRSTQRALAELRALGVLSWTSNDGDIEGVTYALLVDRRGLEPYDAPVVTLTTPRAPHDTAVVTPTTPVSQLPYRGTKTPSLRSGDARDVDAFDEWWDLYPKKVGKPAARRAFKSAAKRAGRDLVEALRQQHEWLTAQHRRGYCPNPTTWLNQDRWDDEQQKQPEPQHEERKPSPWERAEVIDYNTPSCPICPERRLHGHNRDGSVTFR